MARLHAVITTEILEYRDVLAEREHAPGDIVRVLTAYVMDGEFKPDGIEGLYVVHSTMGEHFSPGHYRLIRIPRDASGGASFVPIDYHATEPWDVICHASRLELVSRGDR